MERYLAKAKDNHRKAMARYPKPHDCYHGNLRFRDEDGKEYYQLIPIDDHDCIIDCAKVIVMGLDEAQLQIVTMHYDKHAYNDYSKHELYDLVDGEFIKDKEI